jgi:ubiquinone/menaquinone biosynthesis C-methylase UbiE
MTERLGPRGGTLFAARIGKKEDQFRANMTPEDWSRAYQRDMAHWAEELAPSLYCQEFVDRIKDNEYSDVLEVGCGNGRDSIYFALADYQVTAVDVVPEAIELARANISKAGVRVKTEVANVEDLPFEDNTFDAIFCLSVLHSTNLSKSLPEMYRILRPKGKAFIHIYANTILPDGKIETNVTVDDFIDALKRAGFSIDSFYSEEEKEADESGERHLICVTQVAK